MKSFTSLTFHFSNWAVVKSWVSLVSLTILFFGCNPDDSVVSITETLDYIIAGEIDNADFTQVKDTLISLGRLNHTESVSREYDLDKDGKNDIRFYSFAGGGSEGWGVGVFVRPLQENQIIVSECLEFNGVPEENVAALAKGSRIGNSNTYLQYTGLKEGFMVVSASKDSEYNCWKDELDKYIGLKLVQSGEVKYSWLKASFVVFENKMTTVVESFATLE